MNEARARELLHPNKEGSIHINNEYRIDWVLDHNEGPSLSGMIPHEVLQALVWWGGYIKGIPFYERN
jgi:hypothetical protein